MFEKFLAIPNLYMLYKNKGFTNVYVINTLRGNMENLMLLGPIISNRCFSKVLG